MSSPIAPFPDVANCSSTGRERDTVVADMDGTLLRGRSLFPYFALVAYDMGGVLRLILVLLFYPIVWLLYYIVSESAGIQVLIFASFVGARVEDVESSARAVLPKFYSSDIHPESWRVFSSCGKRCVLTSNPRIMVEPFLKDFLGAHVVLGTEVCSYGGRLTGLVNKPGVLVGKRKANVLRKEFGESMPEIGLGDTVTDFDFIRLCKEGYTVPQNPTMKAVDPDKLPKQIIFHDGRLVAKPTPLMAVLIILWIPIGFILACIRIAVGSLLPINISYYVLWVLGARVKIKGHPPPPDNKFGILFVSSHRTLLDPIIVSGALGRPITALTYSISRLAEMLSPIKTIRLSRDRITDARTIKELLREGDLVIFPEGTTCREPYLLRFSSLFAELTDEIVPVALASYTSMFHGTTVRGWKGMDPFYLFMNPYPYCEVTFLDKLPYEQTCRAGKSSHEVANYVQSLIGGALSYKCTSLTRKDKYQELAGIDGKVVEKKRLRGIKGLVAMLFWRQ